jgi:hypothetical protein
MSVEQIESDRHESFNRDAGNHRPDYRDIGNRGGTDVGRL